MVTDLKCFIVIFYYYFTDADVMKVMKEMGPSAIDKEIRTLCAEEGGSDEVMTYFLEYVTTVLKSNKDFELAHSYLALFLKVSIDGQILTVSHGRLGACYF